MPIALVRKYQISDIVIPFVGQRSSGRENRNTFRDKAIPFATFHPDPVEVPPPHPDTSPFPQPPTPRYPLPMEHANKALARIVRIDDHVRFGP